MGAMRLLLVPLLLFLSLGTGCATAIWCSLPDQGNNICYAENDTDGGEGEHAMLRPK